MKRFAFKSALLIALTYALFSGLWIIFSDRLLLLLIPDATRLTQWQTYKGWAFVFLSAFLLFISLVLEMRRRRKVEEILKESEEKLNGRSSKEDDRFGYRYSPGDGAFQRTR